MMNFTSAVVGTGVSVVALILVGHYLLRRARRSPYSLAGKVVLVTGATSQEGLGFALAAAARSRGCRLVIVTGRQKAQFEDAVLALKQRDAGVSGNVIAEELDLNWSAGDIANQIEAIWSRAGGTIDVLISNAGGSYRGYVLETRFDVQSQLMQANYLGHVTVITEIVKRMRDARVQGRVVAISSVQGRLSIPYRSAYSASKHALQAFMDCLRAEVSGFKIGVLVISPGYLRTNLSRNALRDSGEKHAQLDKTTAKGMAPDLAATVILDALEEGEDELVLAGLVERAGIVLRTVWPALYFYMMDARAAKSKPY